MSKKTDSGFIPLDTDVSKKTGRDYEECFNTLKEYVGKILHELNAETGMAQKEYESAVSWENHLKCIIQHTKKDVLKSIAGRLDRMLVEAG